MSTRTRRHIHPANRKPLNKRKEPKLNELSMSHRDQRILDTILGNEPVKERIFVDVKLSPDPTIPLEKVEKLVSKEKEAIRLAETSPDQISQAVDILTTIIEEEPTYASAYNNRAQMRRLQTNTQARKADEIGEKEEVLIPEEVVHDLKKAIKLASPQHANFKISDMQATVLRNAYCQLAAVYLAQSQYTANWERAWDLHVQASEMMIEASIYGEQIGAALAQSINPYAKLSGNMVESMTNQQTNKTR